MTCLPTLQHFHVNNVIIGKNYFLLFFIRCCIYFWWATKTYTYPWCSNHTSVHNPFYVTDHCWHVWPPFNTYLATNLSICKNFIFTVSWLDAVINFGGLQRPIPTLDVQITSNVITPVTSQITIDMFDHPWLYLECGNFHFYL